MRGFFAALSALPLFCGSAFGWGCDGHQIIALIARAHLTPRASEAVDALLRNNPIDPALSRYCKDRSADIMADASTWADDVRTTEKNGPWHQMDIPLSVRQTATSDVMTWCPPIGRTTDGKGWTGCVIDALQYELGILRQKATPAATRATALRYVIHFASDLHQPLHTTDNDDFGGNCTVITFFSEAKPTNLHSIWDSLIIQREFALKGISRDQYAAVLDRRFASRWNDWGTSKTGIAEWVWEGHKLAADVTYGALHPAIPVEDPGQPTDCNAEKARVAALHIAIGDDYFRQSAPVVEEQLVKAGYRLAAILNQTFGAPDAEK